MGKDRFRFALQMLENAAWEVGYWSGAHDHVHDNLRKTIAVQARDEADAVRKRREEELLEMVEEDSHG